MAPKKNKLNGFSVFTNEWIKQNQPNLNFSEAVLIVNSIWSNMSEQERQPYKELAKNGKYSLMKNNTNKIKLNNCGTPLSQVEKERKDMEFKQNQMKRYVEQTVKQSVQRAELEHQKYYFISINYFSKTLNGEAYLPAELALCEFSLKLGINRIYHTFINPKVRIYGLQYDAQVYSDSTHKLPLPPNALGEENLEDIYTAILEFLKGTKVNKYDNESDEYPPVYTLRDNVPIVESCLQFFQTAPTASDVQLKVYPIQYLFYIMKLATCEQGEITDTPTNIYVSDAYFARDPFEFQIGIACQFHESCDRAKYCSKSFVCRWCYMFTDYMCNDIAIKLHPGRHVPHNIPLDAIVVSNTSNKTSTNKSTGGAYNNYNFRNDSEKSDCGVENTTYTSKDFPPLSNRTKQHKRQLLSFANSLKSEKETGDNETSTAESNSPSPNIKLSPRDYNDAYDNEEEKPTSSSKLLSMHLKQKLPESNFRQDNSANSSLNNTGTEKTYILGRSREREGGRGRGGRNGREGGRDGGREGRREGGRGDGCVRERNRTYTS